MMKTLVFFLFLCIQGGSAPPQAHTITEFRRLYDRSPFTAKPVEAQTEVKSVLEDWALAGVVVNPLGGHTVTVVNKKNRSERHRIQSNGEYMLDGAPQAKVLEIDNAGLDYKETKVKLEMGGQTGWVKYDVKLLAIKPAAQPNRRAGTGNGNNTNSRREILPQRRSRNTNTSVKEGNTTLPTATNQALNNALRNGKSAAGAAGLSLPSGLSNSAADNTAGSATTSEKSSSSEPKQRQPKIRRVISPR